MYYTTFSDSKYNKFLLFWAILLSFAMFMSVSVSVGFLSLDRVFCVTLTDSYTDQKRRYLAILNLTTQILFYSIVVYVESEGNRETDALFEEVSKLNILFYKLVSIDCFVITCIGQKHSIYVVVKFVLGGINTILGVTFTFCFFYLKRKLINNKGQQKVKSLQF